MVVVEIGMKYRLTHPAKFVIKSTADYLFSEEGRPELDKLETGFSL